MKAMLRPLPVAIAVALFAAATESQAQYAPGSPYQYQYGYPTLPFYLGVDVGGDILQDMTVRNVGSTINYNPGVRADFAFGYQIADPVAVEFETGSIWNEMRAINGVSLDSIGERGDLYQVPFLANVVLRVPFQNGFSGYIGVGAGGVASELDLRQHNASGWFHSSDTDVTFAYQGKIGVNYALNEQMEVGVGYKFLGTLAHTWFQDDPALFANTAPAYSHSFVASFTWKF